MVLPVIDADGDSVSHADSDAGAVVDAGTNSGADSCSCEWCCMRAMPSTCQQCWSI